jgi:16S rRNA (uracil1498-N3)-methyltransferase
MHNFFGFINDDYAFLESDEINHAIKSLRLGIGEKIKVFDGVGKIFVGEIDLISKKEVRAVKIEIIENHGLVNGYLHIAISPTKSIDRWNFFLEKATEIGVHEITPIISSHSERKFISKKRSKKILKSACLQSEKSILPKINELTSLKNLIKNDYAYYKYIATCSSIDKLSLNDLIRYPDRAQSIILIGPEGDFSTSEVTSAIKNGFEPVSLGEHRLRTETAGICVSATHARNTQNT